MVTGVGDDTGDDAGNADEDGDDDASFFPLETPLRRGEISTA